MLTWKVSYETAEASRVVHRQSNEYKAFRGAVGPEGLLERPSDLEFWYSTSIGFLAKEGQATFATINAASPQYIVTDEMAVAAENKDKLFLQLRRIAEAAQHDANVQTFWVLDRPGQSGSEIAHNVYVLSRFRDKMAYSFLRDEACRTEWDAVTTLVTDRTETTWQESGIGFLGRSSH